MTSPTTGRTALLLARCAPDEVDAVAVGAVEAALPGARARLLLVDHRQEELRAVDDADGADPLAVDGSVQGRCWAAQRPQRPDGRSLVVPVTLRGNRIGVLDVTAEDALPDGADDVVLAVADLLAPALAAAARVTDRYTRARRGRSLSLASELQWELVPGTALRTPGCHVAAHLEPAYTVAGDTWDWAAHGAGVMAMVVDGDGRGVGATSNAVLATAAVRNARREGADLAGAARLADPARHARPDGDTTASALLVACDPDAGRLDLLSAGDTTVWAGPRERLVPLDLPRQPPLGAEDEYPYTATSVAVRPGDRVVLASDGLTAAGVGGRRFGDGFAALAADLRLLDARELTRVVIRELRRSQGSRRLDDDAVVVCLDVSRRARRAGR